MSSDVLPYLHDTMTMTAAAAAVAPSQTSSKLLKAANPSSSPTTTVMMKMPSSGGSRSRGGGGCRRRIDGSGGGGGSIARTTVKSKKTATPSSTKGSRSNARCNHEPNHHGGIAKGVTAAVPSSNKRNDKMIVATDPSPVVAGNDADGDDANDSDGDNSYLLPRTLFQAPSSSMNRNEKLKIMSGREKLPAVTNTTELIEFTAREECSPNEVIAVPAARSPASMEKGSNHHTSKNHNTNYFDSIDIIDDNNMDDQASILSELSNLSTPSANHRRIIHNSHKLACHVILHHPHSDTPTATTTNTTSSSPKDASVQNSASPPPPPPATAVIVPTTTTTTSKGAVPLKHDPEFNLYFRMLRYGFTMNAVRAALRKDGKPDITRLDPERPVDRQKMPRVVAGMPGTVASSSTTITTTTTTGEAGLELNEHGLTDRGWEMALESARKALDERTNNTRTTARIKASPAERKSTRAETKNSENGSMTTMTTRDYSNNAAVGNSPPWLRQKSTCAEHNGILLEGWLHKRTRHGRWVKRWYLIDSSGIYYTHSPPPTPLPSSSTPSSTSSSVSSSSVSKKMKYIKLVDARSLLLCATNMRSPTNPMEFELCHHQSSLVSLSSPVKIPKSASASAVQKRVLVTLKAATVTEVDMWMEAIDCVCERQKLVDEVVVGSASVASVAFVASVAAATVPKSSNVGCRTTADSMTTATATTTTTTDVMNCSRISSTACPTETRLTTDHSFTQPNLLQSRSTLETLASSSDDSLDVFEECFDGHTNIIPISRQQHAATNNECHSNLNEDCGIDLMKAVDDLTRLSTTCYGGNLSEQSKPLVAGVKQHSKDNAMAKMGAGCESKKGNETSDDNNEPMLKLDPKYQKYYAMMKMGLPKQVAQHAMKRDQLDPSILDLDPEKSLRSQLVSKESKCTVEVADPPLKDDPRYSKYFKMLKMGLPKEAAKHAMKRDQLDSSILDLDPEKSMSVQIPTNGCVAIDIGPPLKDDPKYAKYFQMIKIGLPKEVAQHAMVRDQLDPQILSMDPTRSYTSQATTPAPPPLPVTGKQLPSPEQMRSLKIAKAKPKLRRKKVYWNRVDAREGNIWSALRNLEPVLKHDSAEFERLFSQSIDAEKEKEQTDSSRSTSPSAKNVKVIDSKRGMNGDIILRKLKLAPAQIAFMVENMDCSQLESVELRTLYEFMPTEDERKGLASYLENSKSRSNSIADLTPCEQFMVAMKELTDSEEKFQSMIFISEFQGKMAELKWDVSHLSAACKELRASNRFKMLLAMILTLVNKINSIGEDDAAIAHGFSLDSLSKLGETKAFDNKTTVLHYLVQVVRESNKDILKFQEDIKSVVLAKNVEMERLVTTIKKLCEESRAVADIAAKDGEELRKQLKDPQQKDIFMKPQRVSVKEIRQMVTFLSEKDVPIGNMNTTHCERFAMFSKLELQKALGVIKEANQSYIDLLHYFGEDMMSSQAFFGMIDQFMERFDQVADRIETEEQASWKHSRRALNKEAKLRVKSASKSAVDGGNFVSSLKKADDVRVSSAECNENENSTPTTKTARLSNTANGTVESVTVPYDEEAVTGDDTSRKSAQLSPGGIREEGVNAIPISTTLDNVDQIQPSTEEPIPTRVRIGTSKPAWKTSNVGASLSSGVLPSLPSTGFTSIADMAATVARKRNVPVESITTAEPIQRVGKLKSGTAVNHRLNSEHIVALKANGKPTFPSVDKKTDSEILQADVRPTQSVNVAALIALRESGRPPDMKSATAVNHRLESEHRIALKDNKKENLPSVASPTVMNIATMAAEVVRQKKLKQRCEQANKDSQYNRALVEPGDGATTCIVKEHKKDVEARLKRGLVSVEAESIEVKSSSSAIPHTHASYNFINVGSQLAQSTLIVAVNNVAKQKLQKPVGVRKPSKLSLAVAAAAQHRESRFVQ